jgi:selenocysteine lyase/cysteine desulfurase
VSTPLPRDQFPVTEHYRYFDHAGVAAIPLVAAEATQWWIDRMVRQGKVDYDQLDERVEDTRDLFAELMGVPSVDVALVKNVSEGVSYVANGLDWQPGDRVVVPDREFQSLIFPWLALRDRGVQVDLVAPRGEGWSLSVDDIAAVMAQGPPPKVVALSWVQYSRGWRTDLAALTRAAHDAGAMVCADVIQGVGVIPAAMHAWDVDFAITGGQKFQLGPEGIGALYVAEPVRDRLRPLEPGWASVPHRYEWDNLELVWDDSARRFEGGSFNMVGIACMGASLRLLRDAGIDSIWAYVGSLCDRLVDGLEAVDGARVLSDRSAAGRSAIVTFAVDGVDSVALAERLNAQRFVCAPRGGGIRVAPHGYNTADEIDALIAEVVAQSGL